MRRVLVCISFLVLAPMGWAASASFDQLPLSLLADPTTTDTTSTSTTTDPTPTTTDTTPTTTDTTPTTTDTTLTTTDTTPTTTDTTPTTTTTTTDTTPSTTTDTTPTTTDTTPTTTDTTPTTTSPETTTAPPTEPTPPPPPTATTTPAAPTAPDSKAPENVIDLAAVPGDGKVKLTYQIPLDVDHVVITRSTSSGAAAEVVYSGSANTYTDASLENGVEYRYVVRTVDASGNRSAGVAIIGVPRRNMLLEPKDGAKLVKPPKLVWAADVEADYYNVQLLRNGVRILSVWPSKTKTRFVLKKTWRYQGRTYTLRSGRYEWFVWPGFGSREASNYGLLLGARTFQIVR